MLLKIGAGLLAAFIALTIVVHIPAVQYAMGWTHPDGTGACPFGYDKQRRVAATSRAPRTGPFAPERLALGFTLASTSRHDILTWARNNSIKCEAKHGQLALECYDVPKQLIATHGASLTGTTIWFELDENDTVATIKTVRRTAAARDVASAFTATESTLRSRIGSPTTERGSADELAEGAFRQAMVEHLFTNYRAQIRATNMGNGYILTESYAAL